MDQPETTTPTRPGRASRRTVAVAVVVAVVVVVGAAVVWLSGRGPAGGDPVVAGTATSRTPTSDGDGSVTPTQAPSADPDAGEDGATSPPSGSDEAGSAVPVPPLGDLEAVVTSGSAPAATGELSVAVADVSAVTTTADGLGEIAGPGVLVVVTVEGPAGTSLDAVSVAAFGGQDGLPLRPADSDDRAEPLAGTLDDSGTAQGRYLFSAPPDGEAFAVQVLLRRELAPVVVQALTLP